LSDQTGFYSRGPDSVHFLSWLSIELQAAQQTFDATRLMSEAIMAMLSNMEIDAVRLDLHIGASSSAHSQGLAQLAVAYEVGLVPITNPLQ
jgi:hypothetical protein